MRFSRLLKILPMVLCDTAAAALAGLIAVVMTYPGSERAMQLVDFFRYFPIFAVTLVIIFYFLGLYAGLWKYAGVKDGVLTAAGTMIAVVGYMFGSTYWLHLEQRRGFYLLFGQILLILVLCLRFYHLIMTALKRGNLYFKKDTERIMMIGAGEGGSIIATGLSSSHEYRNSRVVCFIDDDPQKLGCRINGIKVIGTRQDIVKAAEDYRIHTIIFAIPSCPEDSRREILEICKQTGCQMKTVPNVCDLKENLKVSQLRQVQIEDLLGREPIRLDCSGVAEYVRGKTVLVTGGGGSIGAELCRQLAGFKPKRLVILDIYENTTYEIQLELAEKFPALDLYVHIGTITDQAMLDTLFGSYRPDIVFHAAAHKHVPLMEDSPRESVKNNVFGTLALASAADRYGTARFVMISTDKAVNPTNVMGATKRMCEMIIQSYNKKSATEFVAVRFGNVLGSHGSVIPLFKKQIAHGGPVTVTHRDIIRYFMTIPEAVSLVLQAGALAKGGEIFVLDMGKPVKILDLAENLIRLSGFKPYKDIDIQFTGLRPGEKLFEELLMDEEGLDATSHNMIYVGKPIDVDSDAFWKSLTHLRKIVDDEDVDIRREIQKIVPTYHPKQVLIGQ